MNDTIKILVADDEAIGRQLLEAILMPEGYNLVFGADGQEALDVALNELPDIILLDVMMPKLDGFEVCKKLREHESTLQTPVFLITALDDRDSRIRGIDAGADDYISKPFDRVEILGKIKNRTVAISRRKQSSATPDTNKTTDSNSEPSVLLPLLLSQLIHRVPLKGLTVVQPSKITDSNHVCITVPWQQGHFVVFISNKLEQPDAPLANAIFINIISSQIQDSLTPSPSKIIQKSVIQLNEFIAEQKSDILAEAGFSFALASVQSDLSEYSLAGINQLVFIKQSNLLNPDQEAEFQPFNLQGNQDLQFSKPTEGVVFSSNITNKLPQQDLLEFLNSSIKDKQEHEFTSQTQNTFKEIHDFLVARLIL